MSLPKIVKLDLTFYFSRIRTGQSDLARTLIIIESPVALFQENVAAFLIRGPSE